MKKAVVTICIGDKYNEIFKLTRNSIENHAKKIEADFIILDEKGDYPHWKKFEIYNLLKEYERILYIDADIIIRDDCPNLFDIVPKEKLGIFNEGNYAPRKGSLEEAIRAYKEPLKKEWYGTYYNTGVMVISRLHRQMFKLPEEIHDAGMYEQPYLNLRILNDEIEVKELDYTFNRMSVMDPLLGISRLNSYVVHYAGGPFPEIMQIMKDDIQKWDLDRPEYKYKKTVLFHVGGGMGDQCSAEPVIRYAKEKLYKDDDVIVVSAWPFLFKHLPVYNFSDSEYNGWENPVKILRTLPSPEESEIWRVIPHTLCHSVDFISMSTLKRILPDKDKQFKLSPSLEGMTEVLDLIDDKTLSESIVVHPGRGWASKTFPKSWWESVINGLVEIGNKVIVIGKSISEEQGYVDIDLPEKGVVDLRNLLSHEALLVLLAKAPLLISNDSAPIHLAGAFDNWIIVMATCKHPDIILPYRNGSKTYKTKGLYRKLTVDEIDSSPTRIKRQTLDYVVGDILDYIPLPEIMVNEAQDIMQLKKD